MESVTLVLEGKDLELVESATSYNNEVYKMPKEVFGYKYVHLQFHDGCESSPHVFFGLLCQDKFDECINTHKAWYDLKTGNLEIYIVD